MEKKDLKQFYRDLEEFDIDYNDIGSLRLEACPTDMGL